MSNSNEGLPDGEVLQPEQHIPGWIGALATASAELHEQRTYIPAAEVRE